MATEVKLQPSDALYSKIVKFPFRWFDKAKLEGRKIDFGYGQDLTKGASLPTLSALFWLLSVAMR